MGGDMGYTIKILTCHGGCAACYEAPIRQCTPEITYDVAAVLQAIDSIKIPENDKDKNPLTLHGGEPLTFPVEHMETLLKAIHAKWGRTGIQTSLAGLNQKHIDLFRKYSTHVGVSIDGDTAELNWGRWDGLKLDKAGIEAKTQETLDAMARLKKARVAMSAIIVLRRYNADPYHVADLVRFIDRLIHDYGITSIRCNELIAKTEAAKTQELTNEELETAFSEIMETALASPGVSIQPFRDVVDLLMGYRGGTCVFTGCDPYGTTAEQTILHDGSIGSCLKTGMGSDAIQGLSADKPGSERNHILQMIEQKDGGCKGCGYWQICHGFCPGSGIDNDWRNRSRFCQAYRALFAMVADRIRGIFPNMILSTDIPGVYLDSPQVLHSISRSTWKQNKAVGIDQLKERQKQAQTTQAVHGNSNHGDIPHGDHHGDSAHPGSEALVKK